MHLHLRSMRGVDAKGRVHISLEDMAEIYRNFHTALNDTYWDTASNHKICTDAMEMLKTTHISKKNGRFLFLFTSVLSEAYSHAHYNMQELLYDNRDDVRTSYWSDILVLYRAVMAKAEKVYSHNKCNQRLALLLHFASLFSLYKDVADEEFIVSLHQRAEECIVSDKHRLTEAELEPIKEYHDAIQTIYHLRGERRQSKGQNAAHEPNEAPTLVIDEEDVTEESQVVAPSEVPLSKDELCAIYDKALQRHQKIVLKRQQTIDQERLGDDELKTSEASASQESATTSAVEVPPKSTPRQRLLSCGQPALIATEAELESVIKSLNTVLASCEQSSENPVPVEKNSFVDEASDTVDIATRPARSATFPEARDDSKEHYETLDDFDFREEFDRRFRQRKTPPSAGVDLPVIGRPNKEDVVQSYRRRGLFDNVDFRQPPSVHHIASVDGPLSAAKTHTAFSFDELDLVAEPEDSNETNNNVLSPNTYLTNKIIRAVLAEKPVSPLQPHHRRTSLII